MNVASAQANGDELNKNKPVQDELYVLLSFARKAPVILQRLQFFFSPLFYGVAQSVRQNPEELATQLTQLLLKTNSHEPHCPSLPLRCTLQ